MQLTEKVQIPTGTRLTWRGASKFHIDNACGLLSKDFRDYNTLIVEYDQQFDIETVCSHRACQAALDRAFD